MPFSYGYHFCADALRNCRKALLTDPPMEKRASLALKELKATAVKVQREISRLEKTGQGTRKR